MRLRVSGKFRSRFPVALAMAFAIDAAAGPCPVSPLPRNGWPGPVDDVNLDAFGHRIETQDRIGLPVDAGDPGVVEGNAFVQRPAHRLHDRAFDLVDQPVRIDHLAAVDRRHRADQTRTAGLAVHLNLGSNGAIGRQILVARKGKAEAAILRRLSGRFFHPKPCAAFSITSRPRWIVEMLQPELDRIGTGERARVRP